jgi:RIO kinase 1
MEEEFFKELKEEKIRRVFAKVFDFHTIQTVHALATKKYFDEVEFVISSGKEAVVFRARDSKNNYRAVKIYKISTSNFKHMNDYIEGDLRFKNIRKTKKDIVFAWTKKEFKNLERARKAGVRVPVPLTFLNNVLVMEFIGKNGIPAPLLKDVKIEGINEVKKIVSKMIEWVALLYNAGLVHADLSEYNVLVNGEELVLIDNGQAVLLSHPRAKEFFERDVKNIANFAIKKGWNKSFNSILALVKKRIKELKKQD